MNDDEFADLEESCGGTGVLHCFCGGDFCACELGGEYPCDGCEDCNPDGDGWDDDDDLY